MPDSNQDMVCRALSNLWGWLVNRVYLSEAVAIGIERLTNRKPSVNFSGRLNFFL
jgi:hypothetical protein